MNIQIEDFINSLKTIKNYSATHNITTSYVYKLIKEGKLQSVVIDGVQFVDSGKYPNIPVNKRRK